MSKSYRDKQHKAVEAADERDENLLEGLIVDGSRGQYLVETDAGAYRCTIRGRLRKTLGEVERDYDGKRARNVAVKPHDPVAVGDRVCIVSMGGGAGVIEEVVARAGGAFTRRDPDPKQGDLTTVANIDQMAIVFAVRNPEPHLGLLDRFLVVAEAQDILPLIVINKVDLGLPEGLTERLAVYERLGYPVLLTSVATGQGIEELRARLAGRTSALLGKSGVGKSSLLNAVEPAIDQRVSYVSGATGKGRHTTTATRLFALSGPDGGYIADTAGIRALGLNDAIGRDLDQHFPEFRPYRGGCQMRGCTHTREPGCAVIEAVRSGVVDRLRYASYCRMLDVESALDDDAQDDDPEPLAYLAGEWAATGTRG